MVKEKKKLIVILGPTASGKSKLAVPLAEKYHGEIISADASQIYQLMDIGTAKIKKEEMVGPQGNLVPHHLLDILPPDGSYTVADFQKQARACIAEVHANGKLPFLVGGSGLYINAVIDPYVFTATKPDGMQKLRQQLKTELAQNGAQSMHDKLAKIDPQAALRLHPNDARRVLRALEIYFATGKTMLETQKEESVLTNPDYDLLLIGLTMERSLLYAKIDQRVDKMLADGLLTEVEYLLQLDYVPNCNSLQALGYRQMIQYLQGLITKEEAIYIIKRDTRHFAKRQITWFKRDPRIVWLTADDASFASVLAAAEKEIELFLNKREKVT